MKITKIIPLVSLLGLTFTVTPLMSWAEDGQDSNSGGSDSGSGSESGGDSDGEGDGDSNGFNNECGSGTPNGSCGGGDSGPSAEEKDADEIKSSIAETFSRIWDSITNWGSSADEEANQTDSNTQSALSANAETQAQSSQIAQDGTTTGCPVELYSGCKVTHENDF